LLTRILSALVLIPVVVGIIWFAPPIATQLLLLLVMMISLKELMNLTVGRTAARVGLALLWIALPLALLADIRQSYGPAVMLLLFVLIVVSDSAQYFAGRAFGRHKLAPVISPKKTIEGSIGGLVAATAIAPWLGSLWLPEVPGVWMALAGAVIAVAGMAGDLFESALKRKARIKDSGNLIPGHGGILDRIDAFLFAGPVYYAFLRLAA
jgi:phosphatidate cytidylyltransferase